MMKVGDFVISKYGPLYSEHTIVIVTRIDPIGGQFIHILQRHASEYLTKLDAGNRYNIAPHNIIENPKLEAIAKCLQYAPLVIPKFKDQLSEWLKQKVIEEFGEPPKKIVEAALKDGPAGWRKDIEDPLAVLVPAKQIPSFIRYNRKGE